MLCHLLCKETLANCGRLYPQVRDVDLGRTLHFMIALPAVYFRIAPKVTMHLTSLAISDRDDKSSGEAASLAQLCRFSIAAFELEDHALDVAVILVRLQELQTLLRIAPLQNLNGLLSRAP